MLATPRHPIPGARRAGIESLGGDPHDRGSSPALGGGAGRVGSPPVKGGLGGFGGANPDIARVGSRWRIERSSGFLPPWCNIQASRSISLQGAAGGSVDGRCPLMPASMCQLRCSVRSRKGVGQRPAGRPGKHESCGADRGAQRCFPGARCAAPLVFPTGLAEARALGFRSVVSAPLVRSS